MIIPLVISGYDAHIARNFTKKADLLKLINQLAAYKNKRASFPF